MHHYEIEVCMCNGIFPCSNLFTQFVYQWDDVVGRGRYLKCAETLPSVATKVSPLATNATVHPVPRCTTVKSIQNFSVREQYEVYLV